MADQITISGLSELRQTLLKELPEALQGKASQAALAKAARPMVAMARSLAPMQAPPAGFMGPLPQGVKRVGLRGLLKKSIYSYRNRNSTRTYESRFIGVRKRAFYWRWIEFGRATISRAKGSFGNDRKGFFGKTVKAVPPKPFLRPAFEAMKMRSIEIYRQSLIPAVNKVSAKARAKTIRQIRKTLTGF